MNQTKDHQLGVSSLRVRVDRFTTQGRLNEEKGKNPASTIASSDRSTLISQHINLNNPRI